MRELEFLPEDYVRARFDRRLGFIRSWLLLAVGLVMVLWSLQMGAWVRDAEAELTALRGTGYSMDADVVRAERLRIEALDHNRRLAALATLTGRVSVSRILGRLSDLLPRDVRLDQVEIVCRTETREPPNGGDASEVASPLAWLSIRGTAPSDRVVGQALGALEESTVFERPVLIESKSRKGGASADRRFVLECGARRVVGSTAAEESRSAAPKACRPKSEDPGGSDGEASS